HCAPRPRRGDAAARRGRRLEARRRRRPDVAHTRPPRDERRAALFRAVHHGPSGAGLVRALARKCCALSAVCAVQSGLAARALLAFTGHMTLNIAAIPFFWVLPLALYLLSFVLCFEASGWYRRWLFLPLLTAGFAGVCVTLTRSNPSIWTLIPLYCATLFAACM